MSECAMVDTGSKKPLSRAENAAYVIEQLRELGFEANPGSRLMRMHKVWQRGPHKFGTPDFWIALESDRDMLQLGFVLEQLGAYGDKTAFVEVVRRMLSDSVLSQHDRKRSPGRDAQFELYLAAVCQKAGMLPVGYEEPDVTCTVAGVSFGIAAKRIKSLQQAGKRIKEAADQIADHKRPGIIALDISIGFNRNNSPIISPLHNQMIDTINDAQANQLFYKHEHLIKKCCLGRGVLGIVLFDFRTRVKTNEWCQHRFAMWMDLFENVRDLRVYREFYDRFIAVIPNRQDTID